MLRCLQILAATTYAGNIIVGIEADLRKYQQEGINWIGCPPISNNSFLNHCPSTNVARESLHRCLQSLVGTTYAAYFLMLIAVMIEADLRKYQQEGINWIGCAARFRAMRSKICRVSKHCNRKPTPNSGLDRLICATFARQRFDSADV